MSKRILSIFMAVLFSLNCFPFAALADAKSDKGLIGISSVSDLYEESEDETVYWYNNSKNTLTVNISDGESGLATVKIFDEYSGKSTVLDEKVFSENQENNYSFSIEISKLIEGIHHINVEVTDNAGNQCGNYPIVQAMVYTHT